MRFPTIREIYTMNRIAKAPSISTRPQGVITIELVLSAGLIIACIGLLASLAPRIVGKWQESRHYQLVTNELANQIEMLTHVDDSHYEEAWQSVVVSPELLEALPTATLSKAVQDDELGQRITLSISWDRGPGAPPLSMSGWRRVPPKPAERLTAEESPSPATDVAPTTKPQETLL
jgi:hypothetical protein